MKVISSGANWGGGEHKLSVVIERIQAPPSVAGFLATTYRSRILRAGAPFKVKGGIGSWYIETDSCDNSPIDDCNSGTVLVLVGTTFAIVTVY